MSGIDIKTLHAQYRAKRARLLRAMRHARAARITFADTGNAVLLHETCSGEQEPWRLTWFDADGTPTGHILVRSRHDAAREIYGDISTIEVKS